MMLYQSTRGNGEPVTVTEAIKQGIAPDGGLFVPTGPVGISLEDIVNMAPTSYQTRAIQVMEPFLTGFDQGELAQCVQDAYNDNSFDHPSIAPLTTLTRELSVLELWHGPTYAFKDMALQLLPHLLVKSMEKTGETQSILILVATSGDTGKAALEGFKNVPGTAIVVFYPDTGVSPVQKLQMITQEGNNVGVFAVRGNFDDAQSGVKNIFADVAFGHQIGTHGFKLSSANSINWGRLLPQIVYYFSSYADLLHTGVIKLGEKINFVVPTGNFGNILAGFYAAKMGLPVHKLICAANENNVLTDFIRTGVYDRHRVFKKTLSPSMDILISSNLERLLFELTGHNATMVRQWMQDLQEHGRYRVDDDTRDRVSQLFWSDFADDQDTLIAIEETYTRYGYVVDPHTAVAMRVQRRYQETTGDRHHMVVMSTASPFKFGASVAQALLGPEKTAGQSEYTLLETLADFCNLELPKGLSNIHQLPILHNQVVDKDKMKETVATFIGQHTKNR